MNTYPELTQIEHALVAAARSLAAGQRRRTRRRPRLVLVAALLALLVGGAVVAGAADEGPLAGQLHGIFGSGAAPAPRVLAPGGEELKEALDIAPSQGGRVLLPAAGKQRVNVNAYAKGGKVCLVVSGQGGIGHCVDHLREAGGHLAVSLGVVDSEPFVFGLAADDVTAVTVSVGGTDYAATVTNSAFFVALPSQEAASHPITVTVRLADGSTRVAHVPGLPVPIRAVGLRSLREPTRARAPRGRRRTPACPRCRRADPPGAP